MGARVDLLGVVNRLAPMAQRLDGKEVAAHLFAQIAEQSKGLKVRPKLVVLLVGSDPASQTYVQAKSKRCELLGFKGDTIRLPETISQQALLEQIALYNNDNTVHGILVQLPLPPGIDPMVISDAIDPKKDVDGLNQLNVGRLWQGRDCLLPCTPAGVIEICDYYKIPIEGKHAVVAGRSDIVGKPMAQLLLRRNATVTLCHSRTEDLAEITRQADIFVAAVGRPKMFGADHIKQGAVVIDVGIHRVGGKIVGDVDAESVESKAAWLTPVPGGVGRMTIAMLMQNVLKAARF